MIVQVALLHKRLNLRLLSESRTMRDDHFIAERLPEQNGFSWTLPSRLGAMLRKAEESYGERDRDWTVLGIEFGPDRPRIWYPGNCQHIVVQLDPNELDDERLACYQLAHECVHLLAPTGNNEATVLEEGLATVFAEGWVTAKFKGTKRSDYTNDPAYRNAAAAVRGLLEVHQDAIRRLRSVEPVFDRMTPETFHRAEISLGKERVDRLLKRFNQ